MALATVHPAAVASLVLQFFGGDDIATRVDVFDQIFLAFLVLGTLVGVIVVSYMLHKAYKYRAGADAEYDVGRPELGELPTGADKGGRKLFLSFTISAIIVISLIGWTYGWLLYVETGTAEVPEDAVEVEVVGDNFAWEFTYEGDQRLSTDQINESVEVIGQDGTLEAIQEAEGDPDTSLDAAIAERMSEAQDEEVSPDDVNTNLFVTGELRVPVDREVHIRTTGGDVWHNFGIPQFRVKADAKPGEYTTTWFVPDQTGEFTAKCFELCGAGHSSMQANVVSMPQDEYDAWYESQTIDRDELVAQLEAGEYQAAGGSADDESGDAASDGEQTDGNQTDDQQSDGGTGNETTTDQQSETNQTATDEESAAATGVTAA